MTFKTLFNILCLKFFINILLGSLIILIDVNKYKGQMLLCLAWYQNMLCESMSDISNDNKPKSWSDLTLNDDI